MPRPVECPGDRQPDDQKLGPGHRRTRQKLGVPFGRRPLLPGRTEHRQGKRNEPPLNGAARSGLRQRAAWQALARPGPARHSGHRRPDRARQSARAPGWIEEAARQAPDGRSVTVPGTHGFPCIAPESTTALVLRAGHL
ncbi:hypothetical protein ABZ517_10630 [Streptomyces scabiei]|uniref:hypothetical protein n=1 Tax=Streptomyces scabiei TaxID=1930 RepID=UPI0033CDF938